MGGRQATGAALAALALTAVAPAARAAAPTACPGAAITPTQVITGEFPSTMQGSYVLLPFEVPAQTTAVRVKYCYDQPDVPNPVVRHTLDLDLYDARPTADTLWGVNEFRGAGGSSHPDVTVSPEGFKGEAEYEASPKGHVAGKTTRGFRPGPIPPGKWAVQLGAAGIADQSQGDLDGKVAWRVEIELSTNPAYADEVGRYVPAPYNTTPAKSIPGWYAGDFHVHAEHSTLGDATMRETFAFAFRPLNEGGAGLDFITLSDYVSNTAWNEIGRHQPDHAGKLIMRSAEVITYRGHINNHGSATYVDHRTGPVLERQQSSGALVTRRAARPASAVFDAIHAAGGFTQINHPKIFPSEVPPFALFCRGCSWSYPAADTNYAKVDAIEIATGPGGLQDPDLGLGPNPFTPLAIQYYEDALATGAKIAAVGSSDSHHAGETGGGTADAVTQSPIGQATTVVYADELSEKGVQRAVQAGHTYVKVFGNDEPDLRFEAQPTGGTGPPAIFGDTVKAASATFTARVLGAGDGEHQLLVIKDGAPLLSVPVPVASNDFALPFRSVGPGRYRLQLQRGSTIVAVGSPIYLEAAAPGGGGANPGQGTAPGATGTAGARGTTTRRRPLTVVTHTLARPPVLGGAFVVRCEARGDGARGCTVRARSGRRVVGSGYIRLPRGGSGLVRVRLNALGRRLLRARPRGLPVALTFTALGAGRATRSRNRAAALYIPRRPATRPRR
ncbi:MAG: CehA/McbA family metallohydrolase [Solirubrobacteraceae bacterium]